MCPGTVDSPWVRRLVDEVGESLDALRARQPMGRLGTTDEVAQAVLYLASDAAAFVTGTGLVIDGGLTAAEAEGPRHPDRPGPHQAPPGRAGGERGAGGALDTLRDRQWSDWLPIHAWVIEHPDGTIVVDTGETARVNEPGYLPRWHPYYRLGVRFEIAPEDELGPQLERLGLDPAGVRTVVLTHLHHDHADGLHHLPNARVLVTAREQRAAAGLRGRLGGYLLDHRPPGLRMETLDARARPDGRVRRGGAASPTASARWRRPATRRATSRSSSRASRRSSSPATRPIASTCSWTAASTASRRTTPRRREASPALRAFVQATGAVCLPTHDPDAARRLAAADLLPTP